MDVPSARVGRCELYFLRDGAFWLDAGAYFGVVPRVIWEKLVEPDELNRVKLHINPVLVKTPDSLVLIDPGLGDKYDEKQRRIFRIEREPDLAGSLAALGLTAADIDVVIGSHMHFDHIGACTRWDGTGQAVPVFANARHYFQAGEWQDAAHPNERTKTAYLRDDFLPLEEAGLVTLLQGSQQVLPHIRVEVTGGHTRWHQIILIESEGETAVFLGGIVPAVTHLQIPYTMGFDLYPVEVMDRRRELYQRAIEGRWLVCLEHECGVPAGYIGHDGKRYTWVPHNFA